MDPPPPHLTGPDTGVIILAGGASRRMGADKAQVDWDGAPALSRLAATIEGMGLGPLLVSGSDHGLPFVPDPSPQAGPVAGLQAAAEVLTAKGCTRLLVLAVDAPTLRAADLAPLLAAPAPGAAYEGLPLPMVIAASAIPQGVRSDAALRRFVAEAGLAVLPSPPGALARLRGANTPQERQMLLEPPPSE